MQKETVIQRGGVAVWKMLAFLMRMALASVLTLPSCGAMATRAGQRSSNIVIIGGGAAGLAAALEASTSGTEVYLLEKMSKVGGNSAKASSG
jgi:heterodisulfide reductase subunit A-like polyferredoxin